MPPLDDASQEPTGREQHKARLHELATLHKTRSLTEAEWLEFARLATALGNTQAAERAIAEVQKLVATRQASTGEEPQGSEPNEQHQARLNELLALRDARVSDGQSLTEAEWRSVADTYDALGRNTEAEDARAKAMQSRLAVAPRYATGSTPARQDPQPMQGYVAPPVNQAGSACYPRRNTGYSPPFIKASKANQETLAGCFGCLLLPLAIYYLVWLSTPAPPPAKSRSAAEKALRDAQRQQDQTTIEQGLRQFQRDNPP